MRSYAAFREYYDRWAETWERQALIKARAVAGDPELGRAFIDLVQPVVYRQLQGPAVLEDVREMRAAMESRLESAGEMERSVKEGRGTIRDVEFTVQLIQLLFGADQPALRAPDTRTALQRLEQYGVLTPEERAVFDEGYTFFRMVEHRLQLLNDLPVRLIPTDPEELRRLARSVDLADSEDFIEAYRRHSEGVRGLALRIQTRLGAAAEGVESPLRAAIMTAHTEAGLAALRAELEGRGFEEAVLPALLRLALGPQDAPHPAATRRLFADLAPALLDACRGAADPNLALVGLDQFAARKLLYRSFFQTLREHPEALRDLCRFAGAAPASLKSVLRFPELADFITDQAALALPRTRDQMAADLRARLAAATPERRLSTLRRFKLRELVRFSARHVLQPVPSSVETAEWSELADVLVEAALQVALDRMRKAGRWPVECAGEFAVFALGRFGGRDLHFASDLDLLYLSRSTSELKAQHYEHLAAELGRVLTDVTEEGALFQVDLRLRPEGRQGFAVASLEAARRYYGEGGRGETWEFQTLTRLRRVAGNQELADEFQALAHSRVYRQPMPEGWTEEIRRMKRRIETERVPAAARARHLKLGPGGLSDIEFLVQYLQLRHGGARPELRGSSTLEALGALQTTGLLVPEDTVILRQGLELLTRLRQDLYLLRPEETDVLPEGKLGLSLARASGRETAEALLQEYAEVTARVRGVFSSHLGGPENPIHQGRGG